MRLARLARTSAEVAATRSRKRKVALLAGCLRDLAPAEVSAATAFLMGELPTGRIGVGPAALREVAGSGAAPPAAVTRSVGGVEVALTEVAATRGAGSQSAKRERLRRLLAEATTEERGFLLRLLLGELRQGALEGVVTEAVAQAAHLPAQAVRRAAMLSGDRLAAARAALQEGEAGRARFDVRLFQPLQPMLAQTSDSFAEALTRLERAGLEAKLDGARVQVHRADDEVRVYTRTLRDVTAAVPEVVDAARALPCREVILDGEVLALREDGTPHPFQTTMRRFGRKLDVPALRGGLPLSSFFFDCLLVDGQALIDAPGRERWAALEALAPGSQRVLRLETDDPEAADAFYAEVLARGHEGVMAKSLAAPYAAGRRGSEWLKVKPAHTFDLVVLAAEWGSGRRSGWLSNLHLGARAGDGFAMIGKTFKGMTDATLTWQTERLQALAVHREGHVVYVRPELVVEIAFNDVQASPRYPSGVALRFARLKRYRDDKRPGEVDTLEAVRALLPSSLRRASPPPEGEDA